MTPETEEPTPDPESPRWLETGTLLAAYIPDFQIDELLLYFSPSLAEAKEVYHDLPAKPRDRWGGYFTRKGVRFLSDPSSVPAAEGPFRVRPEGLRLEILEPGKLFSPKPAFRVREGTEPAPVVSLEKKRPFDQWKPTYIKSHAFMKRYEPPHAVPRAVDYAMWEVEECGEIPGSVSWINAEKILLEHARGNPEIQAVIADIFEKRSEEFTLGSEIYLRVLGQSDEEGLKRVCAYHDYPMKTKRIQVARVLAQLGDRRSLDALLVLLDDEEPEVRASALQAIGSAGISGDHPAAERLREIQESGEIAHRVWATTALYRGGDEQQQKALIQFIKEEELPLMDMGEMGQLLVDLEMVSAIPFLIKRLRSERPEIRDDAAEVMRGLTGEDAGFHGTDDLPERRKAIKVWERWWNEHKKQLKQDRRQESAT